MFFYQENSSPFLPGPSQSFTASILNYFSFGKVISWLSWLRKSAIDSWQISNKGKLLTVRVGIFFMANSMEIFDSKTIFQVICNLMHCRNQNSIFKTDPHCVATRGTHGVMSLVCGLIRSNKCGKVYLCVIQLKIKMWSRWHDVTVTMW